MLRLIVATGLLGFPAIAPATTYFWNSSAPAGEPLTYGSGTLGTSGANWTSNSGASYVGWTNSTGDTMQFGSNTAGLYTGGSTAPAFTLAVTGSITLGEIVVSGNLTSGNSITFSDSGTSTNTLTFGGNSEISNNSGGSSLIFSAQIVGAGSSGLFDESISKVIFANNNSYTGGTIIEGGGSGVGGVLQIGNGGTTGSLGSGGVTFALSGQTTACTLDFDRSDAYTATNAIGLASTTTTGAIIQQSGTNTLTLTGAVTDNSIAGLTYNIASNTQGNATTVSGTISGTGNIAKTGAGTLVFTASNTYSGTTAISAGSLLVTSGSLASSLVTVAGEATLGTDGTVTSGTTLSTLNLVSLALSASSSINLWLNSASTASDMVTTSTLSVGGSGIIFTLSSTGSSLTGSSYTLLTWSNTGVNNILGDFSVNYKGGGTPSGYTLAEVNGSSSDSIELIAAVPEPATWAMTGLGLAVVLLGRRKSNGSASDS